MGSNMDFEKIMPDALSRYVPAGLLGILVAGLLAAFMSNFAATVNAAPPYIVNDIYKRFINPHASEKTYLRLSYAASFGVVVLGITFGWFVGSIDAVIKWIVSALWGGYTASNVLKWYWWRFNGFGYFWGMVAGIAGSVLIPLATRLHLIANLSDLNSFPIILALSLIGCFAGTLLTAPDEEAVLKDFYRRVRPWGFWGPIREKVQKEDPSFQPNPDFLRDMFNVVVGIVWQTSLVVFPVYLVIRRYEISATAFGIALLTSVVLKFTWYDHLKTVERMEVAHQRPAMAIPTAS
jgi:Na+/proline symporter